MLTLSCDMRHLWFPFNNKNRKYNKIRVKYIEFYLFGLEYFERKLYFIFISQFHCIYLRKYKQYVYIKCGQFMYRNCKNKVEKNKGSNTGKRARRKWFLVSWRPIEIFPAVYCIGKGWQGSNLQSLSLCSQVVETGLVRLYYGKPNRGP